MTETIQHPPMPEPVLPPSAFELSVPRNAQSERIGTGAVAEPLRSGFPGETLRGTILKALFRAGRTMQTPSGKQERDDIRESASSLATKRSELNDEIAAQEATAKPQDGNEGAKQPADKNEKTRQQETELIHFYNRRDGYEQFALQLPRNYTEEDVNNALKRAGFNYRYSLEQWLPKSDKTVIDERIAQGKDPNTETIVLRSEKDGHVLATFEAPKNATRAELNRVAQAAGLNYTYSSERTPQQQDKSEVAKNTAERKTKEPETEPVKFYSEKDGHELFTLQLPKGGKYTTADVNRALKAAGYDFTYSPSWTPGGWRVRGRDVLQAIKKTWQDSAPPSSQPPGQKAA